MIVVEDELWLSFDGLVEYRITSFCAPELSSFVVQTLQTEFVAHGARFRRGEVLSDEQDCTIKKSCSDWTCQRCQVESLKCKMYVFKRSKVQLTHTKNLEAWGEE